MKKWYVMERVGIDDSDAVWKPVDDIKFVKFADPLMVAVVQDHNDDRLFYCVHPARVAYKETKD